MRTVTLILLVGMPAMLLGCGLFDTGQKDSEIDNEVLLAPPPVASVAPSSVDPGAPSPRVAPISYFGPSSLEERIFESPVIVRVRLDSATSTVESATIFDGTTKYIALLEFSFSVLEYLRGSGGSDIVAVWESRPIFDTRHEAEDALPAITTARDTQWDDHEAIIFLQDSQTYLSSTHQAGRFYFSWQHEIDVFDDKYSIASRHKKLWLPAEAVVGETSQPGGDQQRFLMDVPLAMKTDGRILGTLPDGTFLLDEPPATGTTPTITLGEIKARIAAVTVKLAAGDGSEEYVECVRESYHLERRSRYLRETQPDRVYTGSNISPPHVHQFDSGLAGGTAVYKLSEGADITPGVPFEVWLDGENASLFNAASPTQDYRVTTTRPLPAGTYEFHFNHRGPYYSRCDGYAIRYEWTVTVTAPEVALHEAFFDPVAIGSAVGADGANGVLKPASFTDRDGAPATIESISWEAGAVKVRVVPWSSLTRHVLNFIELDGTTSLSLNLANSSVHTGNDTLTWSVASQPWEDGDKLMVRIREAAQ